MIKTYRAKTDISINVVLPSKKNLHISFVSLSNGNSVFTTDNEDLQKAIESHYKFGKLFRLVATQNSEKEVSKDKKKKDTSAPKDENTGKDDTQTEDTPKDDAPKDEDAKDETPEENTPKDENAGEDDNNDGKTVVKVNDINEAKDYLAERFGISRTAMRSTKAILAVATEKGVVFEGI